MKIFEKNKLSNKTNNLSVDIGEGEKGEFVTR